MKKIIVTTLCLSFFVLCGSARAEKKYQILLRYKDGKISKAVNNCRSEVGRLQPVTKIVNGKARTRALGPNMKKVKLRSISDGIVVDEVEFSFDDMRIVHDNFGDAGITGHIEPMEEMTFFAEIPYRKGIIEEIEIVNGEVVEEVIDVEIFVDESGSGELLSSGCNIDIVILPERYEHTPSGLSRFREEAANIRDYTMDRPPFNEFSDKISWYWPTSVDQMTDQGSEPNPEDPSDVEGGVSLWEAGCVGCHAPMIYPDYDELYVLINEPLYHRGSASLVCPFPDPRYDLSNGKYTFSWGTNYPSSYRYILGHEFGHSFIGLDDERIYYHADGTPFIAEYPPRCPETNCCESCDTILLTDFNKDGTVDLYDFMMVIREFHRPDNCQGEPPCICDINGDGLVNVHEAQMLVNEFLLHQTACYWDLEPGCEGCWQGCTYENRHRCNSGCMMRAIPSEWCARCRTLIRWRLEQCFDFN